jgi:hypothetical protein
MSKRSGRAAAAGLWWSEIARVLKVPKQHMIERIAAVA